MRSAGFSRARWGRAGMPPWPCTSANRKPRPRLYRLLPSAISASCPASASRDRWPNPGCVSTALTYRRPSTTPARSMAVASSDSVPLTFSWRAVLPAASWRTSPTSWTGRRPRSTASSAGRRPGTDGNAGVGRPVPVVQPGLRYGRTAAFAADTRRRRQLRHPAGRCWRHTQLPAVGRLHLRRLLLGGAGGNRRRVGRSRGRCGLLLSGAEIGTAPLSTVIL